jgi:3-dehydroquinate synthase
VAIGMTYASVISQKITGFREADRVINLIAKFDLPTFADFYKQQVFEVLKMDKKRERKEINYVLLEKIGRGIVKSVELKKLEQLISSL